MPGCYCFKEKEDEYFEKLYGTGRVYNSLPCPFNMFLDSIAGKADDNYSDTWRDCIVFAYLLLQKEKKHVRKNQFLNIVK